jgi:hypothetical protein
MGLQRLLGVRNSIAPSRARIASRFGLYFALQRHSAALTGSWLSAFGNDPIRVISWSHLRKAHPPPGIG